MRVTLWHYAFIAPARWLRAAEEALSRFADSDDPAALTELLHDWDAEVDRERASARITPAAEDWEVLEAALGRAGGPPLGARREVFRAPWERLRRSLRRLERLEELQGPELFIDNEREILAGAFDAVDKEREPAGMTFALDRIPMDGGPEIIDLGDFGWHVAQLAAGAFPRSLGLGDGIVACLPASLRARLPAFAQLDQFGFIHQQLRWGPEVHASWIVPDATLWAPAQLQGRRALALPAVASSSCRAWGALLPSVPVGDRGGPLCVCDTPEGGPGQGPTQPGPGECMVSFVLVRTSESPPFLQEEDP